MPKARFSIGAVGTVALAALLAVSPLGADFGQDGTDFRLDAAKAFAKGGDADRGDRDRADHADHRGAHGGRAEPGSGGVHVTKVEEGARGIEVEYSNGIREELGNGRYERQDASGRSVLERPASAEDLGRIRSNVTRSGLALAAPEGAHPGPQIPPDARPQRIQRGGTAIEVRYDDGWKEEIAGDRYELKDPNNRTVVERQATQADRDRLMALAGR